TADLLVGLAQFPAGVAALALQLAALRGDLTQLAAHALQALLGILRILRARAAGDRQQQACDGGDPCAHQAGSSRLCPLISAGCGRPSRSSRVGATSRSAPPVRSVAWRSPTYTSGTGPTVCAVCGWPVAGSRIISRLPWSAVMTSAPPAPRTASTTLPMAT